jgi:phosphoribosylanthranilate isomerase
MGATAKICGLKTPDAVDAAIRGGASHLGFIFFAKSPRNIDPQAAGRLADPARASAKIVAVTVDADDAALDRIVDGLAPDFIQLHGRETPERAAEIRRRTGRGVIKALSVSAAEDIQAAAAYEGVADHLMFDAKAPPDALLPGGNGLGFDWDILGERRFSAPWFLAGGLDPGNVADAVRRSGAPLVDVSSGVERAPGVKDPALIQAFLDALGRAG